MKSPQLFSHHSSRSKKKYDTNGDITLLPVGDAADQESSSDDSDSDESGDDSDNYLDSHDNLKVHPMR